LRGRLRCRPVDAERFLEEALDGGADPAALANLEKRAEVLADGVLSLNEADDLQGLSTVQGLAASDVAATHRAFVLAWAHLALTWRTAKGPAPNARN